MNKKDYIVVAIIIILTTAFSSGLTLWLGKMYLNKNGAPESLEVSRQRFEQKLIVERMQTTIDSLRNVEFKVINNIRHIHMEAKKRVPAITNPDSLVISVNNLDKILSE